MNNPEIQSALCAQCPNRNIISRKLAELGVLRASQECAGPDTVNVYDIAGSTGLESGATVVTLLPELRSTDQQCVRDELKLKHGQKVLGTSQQDPKTHFVGAGESHYVGLMQSAFVELGDDAVQQGAKIHYPKPSKYYRRKSAAQFQRYLVDQGLIKPGKRYIRNI